MDSENFGGVWVDSRNICPPHGLQIVGRARLHMRSRFEIYCDILYCGLLNIRNYADDRERCIVEADHLHNIPALLQNFENEQLHQFYWDVEKPCFAAKARPDWLTGFEELWQELELANNMVRPV